MEETQRAVSTLLISGGLSHNPLFIREHADALLTDVIIPEHDSMLAGTAMLAAAALGHYPSVLDAMQAMSRNGTRFSTIETSPSRRLRAYHDVKYETFKDILQLQQSVRSKVAAATRIR